MALHSKDKKSKEKTAAPSHVLFCIIDWQKFFIDQNSPAFISESAKIRANLVGLLNFFSRGGFKIAATRHNNSQTNQSSFLRFYGQVLSRSSPWFELAAPVAGVSSIRIFDKETYSIFENPVFHQFIMRNDLRKIVLAGVQTDKCILANALAGFDRGFEMLVVADACASRSQLRHRAAISLMNNSCAAVVKACELSKIIIDD